MRKLTKILILDKRHCYVNIAENVIQKPLEVVQRRSLEDSSWKSSPVSQLEERKILELQVCATMRGIRLCRRMFLFLAYVYRGI